MRRLQLCRQRRLQSIEFVWNAKPASAKGKEEGGLSGGEWERKDRCESERGMDVRGGDGRMEEEGLFGAGQG